MFFFLRLIYQSPKATKKCTKRRQKQQVDKNKKSCRKILVPTTRNRNILKTIGNGLHSTVDKQKRKKFYKTIKKQPKETQQEMRANCN